MTDAEAPLVVAVRAAYTMAQARPLPQALALAARKAQTLNVAGSPGARPPPGRSLCWQNRGFAATIFESSGV